MKTKLYRTITLVLAIVMLLGVTPVFADEGSYDNHSSGQLSYDPDDSVDLLDIEYNGYHKTVVDTGLSREDWENRNFNLIPYDANIAANPNDYIPFSDYWYYGDRTSAASKTDWSELDNGVCYFTSDVVAHKKENSGTINIYNAADERTIPAYFDGNQHLKTVLAVDYMHTAGFFTTAPALKTVICLDGAIWGDWTNNAKPGMLLYPSFPKNVIVVTGLVQGEMSIGNSNNYYARKIFTNRYEFIEAAKPILASAHLTDRAWSMIPKEFGGQTELDHLGHATYSDWAKNELLKAKDLGISPNLNGDLRQNIRRNQIAAHIRLTYEAICRDTGKPTNYPSPLPETFGSNKSNNAGATSANKLAALGILKGDGTTWTIDGKTYQNYNPSGQLTREQMAAMLTRLAKACGKTLPTGTMPFTDAMSDWAKPEVSACYGAGLIKGTSATTFGALDNVTYEQAVVLCYRAYVYLTTH